MAKEKKDLIEVKEIVESEGLGYAVQHYMSADDVKDPDVAEHWRKAAEHLNALSKLLHLDE